MKIDSLTNRDSARAVLREFYHATSRLEISPKKKALDLVLMILNDARCTYLPEINKLGWNRVIE